MKKTIFTLALLVIAMAAGAQTIKVGFKKGDVRKYTTNSEITFSSMKSTEKCSSTAKSTYTVEDANVNGYTVDYKVDDVTVDGNSEILQQIGDINGLKALKETSAKLSLDKNGAIKDLLNSDDVLTAISKIAIETVNELYAKNPEIEKMVPKSKALMAVNEKINKESALENIRTNSVLELNGKDIKSGAQVDETFVEKLKIKSTYNVSKDGDNTVITKTSVSNMTENDIKAFLKEQMSQAGAISDADFDAAWSQLKMFGMTKVDIDNNSTYTFAPDGWLTSETSDSSVKAMGINVKVTSTTKAE